MANTNRTKGHAAERYFRNMLREWGFTKCITTREGSRLLDNCKIDLMFVSWSLQIKGGAHKGMNPNAILDDMDKLLEWNFPKNDPEKFKLKVLIHRKGIYKKAWRDDDVYIECDPTRLSPAFMALCSERTTTSKKIRPYYKTVLKTSMGVFFDHIIKNTDEYRESRTESIVDR